MATVKTRIQAMDDFQVIRYFKAFSEQLLAGSSTSFDAIKGGDSRVGARGGRVATGRNLDAYASRTVSGAGRRGSDVAQHPAAPGR